MKMRLIRALRRFRDDQSGNITLEFMIWLPVLLTWITFTWTVFQALDHRGDAAKATYTIADLVSRHTEEVEQDWLNTVATLGTQLLPQSNGNLMRVSSLMVKDGELIVDWSACFGGIEALSDGDIPTNLVPSMAELDTVILVETFVPYATISDFIGVDKFLWSNQLVVRPRWVSRINVSISDPPVLCAG